VLSSIQYIALTAAAAISASCTTTASADSIQFIFTSDAHYGLHRAEFRGRANVDAQTVNRAMVARMNDLQHEIGPIDFIVEGGDIANREEADGPSAIQPAAASWAQFENDYFGGLRLTTRSGARSPLYVVPGNHDLSNAVGFYKAMTPPIDNSAMLSIFNRMMRPTVARTSTTLNPASDLVNFSRDLGGVHFVFLSLWPDSLGRDWMERDLRTVTSSTPVVVFVHDQPDVEAKHFRNPNSGHGLTATDKFENLLADVFADGPTIDTPSLIEQRALEAFLRRHPNVVAYFHGNSNWNEFYDWNGPDRSIGLHVFRVDSPLKGAVSAGDETQLSFQVGTIDPGRRMLTVRECLWNAHPAAPAVAVEWGDTATVPLTVSSLP
jgi:hypothetical protein